MSVIPSDIMNVAEQAASDLDDIHFNSRSSSWLDDARDIVARAILAERERCAAIADEWDGDIAAAILTPSTGEEQ